MQDPAGDDSFRAAYWSVARDMMSAGGARPVERALDLGCASGLSTRHLCAAFPEAAAVTGIDISPHMVAVARYYEESREVSRTCPRLRLIFQERLERAGDICVRVHEVLQGKMNGKVLMQTG